MQKTTYLKPQPTRVASHGLRKLSRSRRAAAIVLAGAAALCAVTACGTATPTPAPAPKFTNPEAATLITGTTVDFHITTTTGPRTTITATGTLPAGIKLSHGNGGTTLSGIPATGGRYVLFLHARNTAGRASQQLTLTVDQAPQFASADRDTIVAVAFKHNNTPFAVTGYPAPVITEAGELPSGLSFTSSAWGTALISGTPTPFDASGDVTITLTASNSAGSASKAITVVDMTPVSACVILCPLLAGD
jgi:hypothetical protein